jgi:hypothetical protein
MDTLTFISSVVSSLAWPLTSLVVLSLIVFRADRLRAIISSIRFKDIEVTLNKRFEEARAVGDEIPAPQSSQALEKQSSIDDHILKLAAVDSGVAILRSWQKLEGKVIQLIQHNGLIRFTRSDSFIRQLAKLDKLSFEEASLYSKLRGIRNDVVHIHGSSKQPTIAEVVEFDQLVEKLVSRLEEIRQTPGSIGPEE